MEQQRFNDVLNDARMAFSQNSDSYNDIMDELCIECNDEQWEQVRKEFDVKATAAVQMARAKQHPITIRADQWATVADAVGAGWCVARYEGDSIKEIVAFETYLSIRLHSGHIRYMPQVVASHRELSIEWLNQPKIESVGATQENKDFLSTYHNDKPSSVPCAWCKGKVIEFSVPNDIWNTVIRLDGHERDDEYLCMDCFLKALRKALVQPAEAAPEYHAYPTHDFMDTDDLQKALDVSAKEVLSLRQQLTAERQRANKAEAALDDLQHDVGVFAFCGSYIDKDDKESLRSTDTIELLETMEQIKDEMGKYQAALRWYADAQKHELEQDNGVVATKALEEKE